MALEAVVFSQDQPLACYNNFCKEYNNGLSLDPWSYEFCRSNNSVIQWDQDHEVIVNPSYNSSSPEGNNNYYYRTEVAQPQEPPVVMADGGGCGGGRKKRRRRSSKNEEEVEQQRITHIAVERNRRRQMNDYLAVIRSLMPPSYSQRGDQASIVGGAINYVKELEQLLQSVQAHKRTKSQDSDPNITINSSRKTSISSSSSTSHTNNSVHDENDDQPPRVFGEFFNFPQYSSHGHGHGQPTGSWNSAVVSGGKEIEVTMVDGHANVRMLARKHQKQMLRLVSAFQALRLSVLHLNLTSLHPFVLYSFNLKVEDGCQLNSVDDVAAAVNHILTQIQEEAAVLLQ